jgi:selenide,water dikinase
VGETLQSANTPHVFAAGDCAHLSFAPRPKAGVFAVRQAPILLKNLRADLRGGDMAHFNPQNSYLKLISTGRKSAIADKWNLAPKGAWVWQAKDYIDQSFMTQFR